MKKIKKTPLFLIVAWSFLVLSNAFSQNRTIHFEQGTWEEVLKKAGEKNKPVFVDAYAVWCGPCKWMSQNVFTNDTVADFYNENFINVKMDMEKGEGIELAKKWKIRAYPTLIYFTPDGELMHQSCGARNVQEFVALGADALNPEKQIGTLVKKYEEGDRSTDFLVEYLRKLADAYMDGEAVAKEYFNTQKEEELLNEQNWEIISTNVNDINSREFRFLEKNQAQFEQLYGAKEVEDKMQQVYVNLLYGGLSQNDGKAYEESKKQLLSKKNKAAEKSVLMVEVRLAEQKKDWKSYMKMVDRYITNYEKENGMLLNSVAWNVYENITDKKQLTKALGWAKKSVSLNENVYNIDTYAHLLYALGKQNEAIEQEKRAIELAKSENDPILEELEANLQKFQQK